MPIAGKLNRGKYNPKLAKIQTEENLPSTPMWKRKDHLVMACPLRIILNHVHNH